MENNYSPRLQRRKEARKEIKEFKRKAIQEAKSKLRFPYYISHNLYKKLIEDGIKI